MVDFSALRARVAGPVLTAQDGAFADEVFAWNTAVTNAPDVVVGATSAADVAAAIAFARENRLPVRVQSTGHGAEQPVLSGLLITTKRLNRLTIDADTRIARIGAGLRWVDVVMAADARGLTPITGAAATVGVVGFLLGGGLGPLARSHGFASDYVRGFTVVTGAGDTALASADSHPDLFWALRGGKTGLGVVTEVDVQLVPLRTLYAGSLIFARNDIETALRAWVDYTATAPSDVTTSVSILRMPDLPQIPEPLRGQTILSLRFAYPGDSATGVELARPLRDAAPVFIDALGEIPVTAVATIHNDPPTPGPGWISGALLDPINQEFATTVLRHVGPDRQTPLLGVEVRHLGGATTGDVPGGSAVGGRGGAYTLMIVGVPDPALFDGVLPAAAGALVDELSAWIAPETTINFVGRLDPDGQRLRAWSPEVRARLADIRARYDPDGVLAGTLAPVSEA